MFCNQNLHKKKEFDVLQGRHRLRYIKCSCEHSATFHEAFLHAREPLQKALLAEQFPTLWNHIPDIAVVS